MQNEIIVENLYKPPRDNNNTANITVFREESVLRDLDMKNCEALICGDFNIIFWQLMMRRISVIFSIQC